MQWTSRRLGGEEGKKLATRHWQSHWTFSITLTLSSLFLKGPSFRLAGSCSSKKARKWQQFPICSYPGLPLQLFHHLCKVLCVWNTKVGFVFLTDLLSGTMAPIVPTPPELLGDNGCIVMAYWKGKKTRAALLTQAHLPGIAATEWTLLHAGCSPFLLYYS